MKKFLGSKKLMVSAITVMAGAVILLAGLTLAWFVSEGASSGGIVMGRIDVNASLGTLNYDWPQVPDVAGQEHVGTVQNNGNVEALVQLKMFATDANGYVWNNPAIVLEVAEDGIEAGFFDMIDAEDRNARPLGIWVSDTGLYQWMKGADGNYYVYILGNDILHFGYNYGVVGGIPGVNYGELMGAEVNANLDWLAVQSVPTPAVIDTFDGIEGYFEIKDAYGFLIEGYYTDENGNPFFTPFTEEIVVIDADDWTNPGISPFSLNILSAEDKVAAFVDQITCDFFRSIVKTAIS